MIFHGSQTDIPTPGHDPQALDELRPTFPTSPPSFFAHHPSFCSLTLQAPWSVGIAWEAISHFMHVFLSLRSQLSFHLRGATLSIQSQAEPHSHLVPCPFSSCLCSTTTTGP